MRFLLCVVPAILVLGCGSSPPPIGLVPVSGVAKYKGHPLAGAELNFIPVGETKGAGGRALTDATGNYKLIYLRGGDGAPPGKYKITASKRQYKGKEPSPGEQPTAEMVFKELLPHALADADKTNVFVSVPDQGGVVDIDLSTGILKGGVLVPGMPPGTPGGVPPPGFPGMPGGVPPPPKAPRP